LKNTLAYARFASFYPGIVTAAVVTSVLKHKCGVIRQNDSRRS
jgi:hypothetical protein